MRTYLDCIPCFMRQTLSAARLVTKDEKVIKNLLNITGKMIENVPMQKTPAQIGADIYRNIREITGVKDPYKKIKADSIKQAKSMLPAINSLINDSENKLLTAIRIAIAGNVIDFGMDKEFDLAKDLKKILSQDFAIIDFDLFEQQLSLAKNILYLADNAGESVFDKVLIQQLKKPVTYVVREVPVINDVIYEDAVASGIDSVAEIVSSGCSAPGTILELCNNNFLEMFEKTDMVISKGQGNFEGLSDVKRPVFFLLKAKCPVIAQHLYVNENDILLKAINV